MAPERLHPPRETIVRASQWLANTIIEMDQKSIEKNYTFLTHAARALALWRGKFAGEIEVKIPGDKSGNEIAETSAAESSSCHGESSWNST